MIKINITARHFKAHETLQEFIKTQIETLGKYHEEILHADVILSFEKSTNSIKNCELVIKLKDKVLTAKEGSDDYNKSIDLAIGKVKVQLLKYKDKHKTQKKLKVNPLKEEIKTI
ncbi:MAG: ribosome-associated translation inhibitor RaiA [Bacteroidota bacterium]|nr:ribosome-associated translation inhibitor RaiA [Bacteroidota bacterium]